jgi:two-component system CheB/CheR fusion protein
VVGIGASAAGLAALQTFFQQVPADSGLAFVVVVPVLPPLAIPFPVRPIPRNTLLEPNQAYIIPPDFNLNAIDSHLRVSHLEEPAVQRAPIDHFFRTLANTYDGRTVGVILAGTGSDGTLGIRDIRAKGGLAIIQEPHECGYDEMPADFVLPVEQIPAAIQRFARTAPCLIPQDERLLLQKVFSQLRTRTGCDFSHYKPATALRRIERRMQIHSLADFQSYFEMLLEQPREVQALADDLQLTVAHFFQDRRVFEKLENEVIPRLFARKSSRDSIRVWSVGCSTGEEAYSLAMLLLEEAGRHEQPPQIQIFASEPHARSLETARAGFYPGPIEMDVTPGRLQRFFHKQHCGYRIRHEVRDKVIFAKHNLFTDPPFSHLDLIACRNLLVFIERDIQRGVAELFHYALNPEGSVLFGMADAIDFSDLFRPENHDLRLYRKRIGTLAKRGIPVLPIGGARTPVPEPKTPPADELLAPQKLYRRMIVPYVPPSILVGPDNDVVHAERAERYLAQPGSEPAANLFKLAREELRVELRALVLYVRETRQVCDSQAIAVRCGESWGSVVLHVAPACEPECEDYVLIVFEEREPWMPDSRAGEDSRVQTLEAELSVARERLENMIEQYEAAQGEMKVSNHEMHLTMDELRSSMEALRNSLAEKDELLKEVHHRVKNNLQVINSLLNMQARQIGDPRVLALFDELRNRVLSIGAIHELLYRSASFAAIKLTAYAERLVPELIHFYGLQDRIRPKIAGDGATLELERAVPYGLLLNELVSNVCKHAFPDKRPGELTVTISSGDGLIVLKVADNGAGLPPDFDYRRTSSLGFQLIEGLTRQLHATLRVLSGPGTAVQIAIPVDGGSDDTD